MKLNIQEIEKMSVVEIGKKIDRRNRVEIINNQNHYEVQAFGITIEVTNSIEAAHSLFHKLNVSNKTLYHNKESMKCLPAEKLL